MGTPSGGLFCNLGNKTKRCGILWTKMLKTCKREVHFGSLLVN
jgi:hypothetical protein